MRHPRSEWLRWAIILGAVVIGVALIRGVTYALSSATHGLGG